MLSVKMFVVKIHRLLDIFILLAYSINVFNLKDNFRDGMQYSLGSQEANGNVLSTLKTKCHPFSTRSVMHGNLSKTHLAIDNRTKVLHYSKRLKRAEEGGYRTLPYDQFK